MVDECFYCFIIEETIRKEGVQMNQSQVLDRLREELAIPFFNGKIEEREYTEEEYQKIKADLVRYFDDYVRNVEN